MLLHFLLFRNQTFCLSSQCLNFRKAYQNKILLLREFYNKKLHLLIFFNLQDLYTPLSYYEELIKIEKLKISGNNILKQEFKLKSKLFSVRAVKKVYKFLHVKFYEKKNIASGRFA